MLIYNTIKFRIVLLVGILFSAILLPTTIILMRTWLQDASSQNPKIASTAVGRMCVKLVAGEDPTLVTTPSKQLVRYQIITPEGELKQGILPTGASTIKGVPGVCSIPVNWTEQRTQSGSKVTASLTVITDGSYRLGATVLVPTGIDQISQIAELLRIFIPILILLVTVLLWLAVARALSPVQKIIAESNRISVDTLETRIATPRRKDELSELVSHLNKMLERLNIATTKQRQFVSDASHELRSPVATIIALSENNASSKGMDKIHREATRLASLLDALLALSKIKEHLGEISSDVLRVDVGNLIVQDVDRLTVQAERKGLSISTVAVKSVLLQVDPESFISIIRNLLDNALRHAAKEIVVSSQEVVINDKNLVLIEVSDDGTGIAASDKNIVFERFVRLESDRGRGSGGSGLGLALVKELVELHNGVIQVCNSKTGGAVFQILFNCPQKKLLPST